MRRNVLNIESGGGGLFSKNLWRALALFQT
jgi:hypothetical protein